MEHIDQRNVSEVARIRANIEAECEALQNLTLFSRIASHDIINARFKNLDACHKELRTIIGENEATSTIVAIYNEKCSERDKNETCYFCTRQYHQIMLLNGCELREVEDRRSTCMEQYIIKTGLAAKKELR